MIKKARGKGKTMRSIGFGISISLIIGIGIAGINSFPATSQVRTSPVLIKELTPTAPFDKVQATQAIGQGTSTIRGSACAGSRGAIFEAPGRQVYLFPVTPYLEEWVKLMRKAKPDERLTMSPEVFATRMETVTNSQARFEFPQMKPGKYFLYMNFDFDQAMYNDVLVNRRNTGYYIINDYERQNFLVRHNYVLEKFVTVEKDEQTVKISLSPHFHFTLNPNYYRTHGQSAVLGCKSIF